MAATRISAYLRTYEPLEEAAAEHFFFCACTTQKRYVTGGDAYECLLRIYEPLKRGSG
jgi:hypothetical protein